MPGGFNFTPQPGYPGMDPYAQLRPPGMMPGMMGPQGGACLIVSNLVQGRVTPDVLFNLFGVYGDVLRVKILFNKPDTALIQMATHEQAESAISFLQNCPLYGSTLAVNMSKHASIAMPRPDQENATLTKDYSNSTAHRFRSGGGKHGMHLTAPTPVLHVVGIPPAATEDDVKGLFARAGPVVGFKFFACVLPLLLDVNRDANSSFTARIAAWPLCSWAAWPKE
jgi:hnRNP-L/PTB/hephaestus splicing factor